MIKILITQKKLADGCSWYRLVDTFDYAKRHNLAEVAYLNEDMDVESLTQVISQADVFYGRLHENIDTIFSDIKKFNVKKPYVIDIDDVYENLDPLSDHYHYLGTSEVQLSDGTWLWRDGEKNFNIAENKARLEKFKQALRDATAVVVTTFPLRNYALQYNPNVVVLPNAVNPDYFPDIRIKKDNRIDLVWSGGSSHYSDLIEIKPALTRLMNEYPNLHYHHVGQLFKGIVRDLPESRVHTYGWLHPQAHGFRLATIGADIGICPLRINDFNSYKSSIKFYEYSGAGMATVAANMSPYADDIRHKRTGMLYNTVSEFEEQVKYLIDNPLERIQMAQNARQYVMRERNIEKITRERIYFLQKLVEAVNPLSKKDIHVTTHAPFKIEPIKGKNAVGTMEKGIKIMSKLALPLWVSSGNLLGMVRDGQFIDHDTDVDVNVRLEWGQTVPKMDKMFEKAGFTKILTTHYKDVLMQSAYIDPQGVIFDVYFFYTGVKPGVAVNYNMEGIIEKPLKFIDPPGEFKLKGKTYPVPAHLEEYLVWRFGENWKIPAKSKVPWQNEATHLTKW